MSEPNTQITSGEGGGERWNLDRRYVYRNDYGAVGYVDGPGSNPGLRAVVKVYGEDAEETAARIHAALAAPAAKGGTEPLLTWPQCTCGDPIIRCDDQGCHCEICGLPERFVDLTEPASPPPPAGAAGGGSGDLAPAREALARMKAREGEDVDQWAARLAPDLAAAGEAEYRSGDLAALSAGDLDTLDWVASELSGKGQTAAAAVVVKAARRASAPTPDLGAQGEPVAWAYEWHDGYAWTLLTSRRKPKAASDRRNIRPLSFLDEAPAALLSDRVAYAETASIDPEAWNRVKNAAPAGELRDLSQDELEAMSAAYINAMAATPTTSWLHSGGWEAEGATFRAAVIRCMAEALKAVPTPAPAAPRSEPSEEEIARALYDHDNRGCTHVWGWAQDGLDAEYPGTRDLYLKRARAILALLQAPRPGEAGDGWSDDMDAAPKDGSEILLFGNMRRSPVAAWYIGKWWSGGNEGFWSAHSVEVAAKRWAPLPPAPFQPHAARSEGGVR